MIRKLTLLILISLLYYTPFFAQPQPCEEPPTMTSFCEDACIICDIDGFTGRHESSTSGLGPVDFCTIVQHNIQWIAFIAGSVDLDISLAVSNCQLGTGLEIGIYEGVNCENFRRVSDCLGAQSAISEGTSQIFSNTEPLVIGQYYFLIMDGAFGDNCDWTLTVVNGSTEVSPLDFSGEILGESNICPDFPTSYSVDFPTGATEFDWTVNGTSLNISSDVIDYTFPTDGTYTLCVTSRNACNEAPPNCTTVQVESIPVTTIVDFLCEGDSLEVANTVIYEGGFYEFNLQSIQGCDSLVTVDLTELVTPLLNLDVNICEGDTLYVGTSPFTETGNYQEILTSIFECDSIVNLNLTAIVCNITSEDFPNPPICFGENSGSIAFNVVNGTPPFTYAWAELNNTFTGMGNISAAGETVTIENIPKGTYLITIEDDFGNSDIIISEVTEPPVLEVSFLASDFGGINVSCEDSNDGSLQVNASGGVPDYDYLWSNNQTTNERSNLTAGIYTVTLTDQAGCTLVDNFELLAPLPLQLTADFNNPNCEGLSSGFISVLQSEGGTTPYLFSLDNNTFTSEETFSNLTQGFYELEMIDANGCQISVSETLQAPQIPEINLGDNATINLGETYTFPTLLNNINVQEIIWTPAGNFDCAECLNPSFIPLNTGTYTLTVTSEDDCVDTDSITIQVEKFRKFYAPNAFSPNFDGFNDFFTLYGGSEVEMIQKLSVFNRWGGVVFETKEIMAGIETVGWNGVVDGKTVNPDVYIWMAEIRFLDGEVIMYSGDLTVTQ